jgi:uncharacterized protein YjiS (DUF1127 family)
MTTSYSRPSASRREPGAAGGLLLPRAHSLIRSLAARARVLWARYWDYQARRATVLVLDALDDRVLKDIGVARAEIWPAVFGGDHTRPRHYDPRLQETRRLLD